MQGKSVKHACWVESICSKDSKITLYGYIGNVLMEIDLPAFIMKIYSTSLVSHSLLEFVFVLFDYLFLLS